MNRRVLLVVLLVLVLDWVVCLRGRARARGRVGSWSQCMGKSERGLSMNRNAGLRHGLFSVPITPGAVPEAGAPHRPGSWSQCMRKTKGGSPWTVEMALWHHAEVDEFRRKHRPGLWALVFTD
jgi:hypothetical protein